MRFDIPMKGKLDSVLLAIAVGLLATAAPGQAPAPVPPKLPREANLVTALEESLDRGDLDGAIRAGEKAIEADPRNSVAHDLLGRAYGLKAQESQLLEQIRLARRARAFFEKAVGLDPANVSARADLATYDMRAPALLGGGRKKARRQAMEVLSLDPARGHELLGDLAESEKNLAEAGAEYRRAVEASAPRQLRARRALSAFLLRRRRPAHARELWAEVLESDPAAARYELAGVALASGEDLDRAARELEASLSEPSASTEPSRAEMLERLALLEERLGKSERARAALDEAVRLEPHRREWRKTLARLSR